MTVCICAFPPAGIQSCSTVFAAACYELTRTPDHRSLVPYSSARRPSPRCRSYAAILPYSIKPPARLSLGKRSSVSRAWPCHCNLHRMGKEMRIAAGSSRSDPAGPKSSKVVFRVYRECFNESSTASWNQSCVHCFPCSQQLLMAKRHAFRRV